jgi:hypothetical protein
MLVPLPLIIEELASIHLRMIASLGRTGILLDTPKHAFNSLDGIFEILLAFDALSSFTILLAVIAKVVSWRPNVFYCIHVFYAIHDLSRILCTNHEVLDIIAYVVLGHSLFIQLEEPCIVIEFCRHEIQAPNCIGGM